MQIRQFLQAAKRKINLARASLDSKAHVEIKSSMLFDVDYLKRKGLDPSLFVTPEKLITAYLYDKSLWSLATSNDFDGDFYLNEYQDVKNAKVNPLLHYIRNGKSEGRQPVKNRALAMEYHLWRGNSEIMVSRLQRLINNNAASQSEISYARWVLAGWFYYLADFEKAAYYCSSFFETEQFNPNHMGPFIVAILSFLKINDVDKALDYIHQLKKSFPSKLDSYLLESNVLKLYQSKSSKYINRIECINALYSKVNLATVRHVGNSENFYLANLRAIKTAESHQFADYPLVSIIVPVFNASATIRSTLISIAEQTYPNLEIIIVDDASSDESVELVSKEISTFEKNRSRRWSLIQMKDNAGAYAARNEGMSVATGELLTVHDSDDWSHPQKIELQVLALSNHKDKVASVSALARCTADLMFTRWRVTDSLIHRNVSSLMIRRPVFNKLGYWDNIKAGADTEYYYRILTAYGAGSIVEVKPDVPLSFLLQSTNSLTQRKETHISTELVGSRKNYLDAAQRWHKQARKLNKLYMQKNGLNRPFLCPKSLLTNNGDVESPNPIDVVQQSEYFDGPWYIRNNIELQAAMIDPIEHYWSSGQYNDLDPSPSFSTSGYKYKNKGKVFAENSPIYDCLIDNSTSQFDTLFEIRGCKKNHTGNHNILIVAHSAKKDLYGAERSFVDICKAVSSLAYNLYICLPSAENIDYIKVLQKYCCEIFVVPVGWWQNSKPICNRSVDQYLRIIDKYSINLVHLNTLTHDTIVIAAKRRNIPLLTHVREALSLDHDLCETLNSSATQVYDRVIEYSNLIVANSKFMSDEINSNASENSPEKLLVIPNTIEMSELLNIGQHEIEDGGLHVAMISSNLPKKGLSDLIKLSELLLHNKMEMVKVHIFGPKTHSIVEILNRQAAGELSNIIYEGFESNVAEILRRMHVIVNLSSFAESFGRTVLEAMAGSKAVVCYRHGALAELVRDGENGFAVPFGDINLLLERLKLLVDNRELLYEMGLRGRDIAINEYSFELFVAKIETAYQRLLH